MHKKFVKSNYNSYIVVHFLDSSNKHTNDKINKNFKGISTDIFSIYDDFSFSKFFNIDSSLDVYVFDETPISIILFQV